MLDQDEEIIRQRYHPDSPQVKFIEIYDEEVSAEDESLKGAIEAVESIIHSLTEDITDKRRIELHDRLNNLPGGEMSYEDFTNVKKALGTASTTLGEIKKQHEPDRSGIKRDDTQELEPVDEVVYSMAADLNIWGAKRLDSTGDPRLNHLSELSQDIVSFLSEKDDIELEQIDAENTYGREHKDDRFTVLDPSGNFEQYDVEMLANNYC